jgi:hypothetical protein
VQTLVPEADSAELERKVELAERGGIPWNGAQRGRAGRKRKWPKALMSPLL